MLSAAVEELGGRSCRVAFAGELVEEDRQELGPLDAPEEDADDTPPPNRDASLKGGRGRNPRLAQHEGISSGQGTTQQSMDGVASSFSCGDSSDASPHRPQIKVGTRKSVDGCTGRQEARRRSIEVQVRRLCQDIYGIFNSSCEALLLTSLITRLSETFWRRRTLWASA